MVNEEKYKALIGKKIELIINEQYVSKMAWEEKNPQLLTKEGQDTDKEILENRSRVNDVCRLSCTKVYYEAINTYVNKKYNDIKKITFYTDDDAYNKLSFDKKIEILINTCKLHNECGFLLDCARLIYIDKPDEEYLNLINNLEKMHKEIEKMEHHYKTLIYYSIPETKYKSILLAKIYKNKISIMIDTLQQQMDIMTTILIEKFNDIRSFNQVVFTFNQIIKNKTNSSSFEYKKIEGFLIPITFTSNNIKIAFGENPEITILKRKGLHKDTYENSNK